MNNNRTKVTENDLHAYVDGQLSEDKIHAVNALILEDPSIAKKIKDWQLQNELLQGHFSNDRFNEVPKSLDIDNIITAQNSNKSKKKPWYFSLAASALMIAASGTLGWYAHGTSQPPTDSPSFANKAISSHQVFSVEVRHPVEVKADEKDHLVAWLSKRIGHPLKMPELDNEGYSLLGGRLLSMQKGQAAAQFMFENNKGQRITWLVSKNSSYRDKSFLFKNEDKVNSYYWMDSNVAYSISGEIKREDLRKLSEMVYKQINETQSNHVASL